MGFRPLWAEGEARRPRAKGWYFWYHPSAHIVITISYGVLYIEILSYKQVVLKLGIELNKLSLAIHSSQTSKFSSKCWFGNWN